MNLGHIRMCTEGGSRMKQRRLYAQRVVVGRDGERNICLLLLLLFGYLRKDAKLMNTSAVG